MTPRDASARGAPPLPPGFLARPFAHRGLHGPGRAENGLPAIRAAVAAGYGVEIDVRPSADGVAMVFHDETLARMTGAEGPLAGRAAAALGALRLGGTAAAVPTLAQALAAVGGRVPLVIELKGDPASPAGVLEEAVARDLAGYAGPVAVMSFDPRSVAGMAERAGEVPRGLTTAAFGPDWELDGATRDRLRAIAEFDAVGASFVSHEAADLARPRVAELKAAGAGILCWTIRSAAEARAALAHADQITFEGFRPA